MTGLAGAWLRTAAAVGARGDVAGAGAALLARWCELHRRYHDRRHLEDVLARVDLLSEEAADADVVRLGAWFHDAVYDPTADDNEQRSATLAAEVLAGLGVATHRVEEVARLVRLTATHDPDPDDRDGAVLCDADLGVLGGSPEDYARYAAAVRDEYSHVDDPAFASSRAAILRRLLVRPALFRTIRGYATWEAPARANLTAELERLEGVDGTEGTEGIEGIESGQSS